MKKIHTKTAERSAKKKKLRRHKSSKTWSVGIPKNFGPRLQNLLRKDICRHLRRPEGWFDSASDPAFMWDGERCSLTTSGEYCGGTSRLNILGLPWIPPSMMAAEIQATSVLDKFTPKGTIKHIEDATIDLVRETNDGCRQYCLHGWRRLNGPDGELDPVFAEAKRLISRVIGSAPDLDQVVSDGRHGPGSTAGFNRKDSSRFKKWRRFPYESLPYCRDLLSRLVEIDPQLRSLIEETYRTRINDFSIPLEWETIIDDMLWIRNTNTVTTVPKTALKRRPIAKEPMLGVYFQLGVDSIIRRALKRVGVDLDSQDANRRAALEGSLKCTALLGPATIDLSAASDTISIILVKRLLPYAWYKLLMELRSESGVLPSGERIHYWKISSMGNGYTFALESLIFWAISRATVNIVGGQAARKLSVLTYGDDIIVPRLYASSVMHYLTRSGFRVNVDKTFDSGPFRESCGADCYLGYNVRPVFLRRQPKDLRELFSIRNRLYRWGRFHGIKLPEVDKYIKSLTRGAWPTFVGPEDDEEFESTWHVSRDEYMNLRIDHLRSSDKSSPLEARFLHSRGVFRYSALESRPIQRQAGKDWLDCYALLLCSQPFKEAGAVRDVIRYVPRKVKKTTELWFEYKFSAYYVSSKPPAQGKLALQDLQWIRR